MNGKLVPLRYELKNGDTIEILTTANHRPSKDWLKIVKTTKAVNRIRHWIKAEERERCIALGREMFEREFRKKGLNFNNFVNSAELQEVARSFSLRGIEDLLASVGYKKITPSQVIGKLSCMIQEEEPGREDIIAVEKRKSGPPDEGIKVKGVDDVLIRMARCCNPLPGEPIIGYITRGRGITVHRLHCRNLVRGDSIGRSKSTGIPGKTSSTPWTSALSIRETRESWPPSMECSASWTPASSTSRSTRTATTAVCAGCELK